ncbi:unnamed protein product [Eretmochelys imbricata]
MQTLLCNLAEGHLSAAQYSAKLLEVLSAMPWMLYRIYCTSQPPPRAVLKYRDAWGAALSNLDVHHLPNIQRGLRVRSTSPSVLHHHLVILYLWTPKRAVTDDPAHGDGVLDWTSFPNIPKPVREERETETETLRTGEPVCPLCLRDALILQQEKGKLVCPGGTTLIPASEAVD